MRVFESVALDLPYKGSRSYLHGTDMYNAVLGYFGREMPQHLRGPLKMVMHEFARNQVDMNFSIGAERCPRPANARLEFSFADKVSGWLSETERPVLARSPYPEAEIVAGCRIEGQTVASAPTSKFSPIELLVSLTKHLHSTLRPGPAGWAFTRLELQRPLNDTDKDSLEVELLHALGNRLTKSAVHVGETPLGHIYFSAVAA